MGDTRTFNVKTMLMPRYRGEADPRRRGRRHELAVPNRSSAERLLDWLERSGRTNMKLHLDGPRFVVGWREVI